MDQPKVWNNFQNSPKLWRPQRKEERTIGTLNSGFHESNTTPRIKVHKGARLTNNFTPSTRFSTTKYFFNGKIPAAPDDGCEILWEENTPH